MGHLIINMFSSIRGVPRTKMERLAGAKTEKSCMALGQNQSPGRGALYKLDEEVKNLRETRK